MNKKIYGCDITFWQPGDFVLPVVVSLEGTGDHVGVFSRDRQRRSSPFFLHRMEALVVLAVFLLGFNALVRLTSRFGFTRILGPGHVLWIPLVGYLVFRLQQHPPIDLFGAWIRIVIVADSISLVFDITDTIRYIRGDRSDPLEENGR